MPIKAVSVPGVESPFGGDPSQSPKSPTPQFYGSSLFSAGGGERPSAESSVGPGPRLALFFFGELDGKYQPMDIPQP
ncbi:hypothetical protein PCASD_23460 [Puccinia coronata f. sp. avenae]|uniref:Uncharacterized protein n=1 Tax=Puccinia coronata f. sp. avenae TaxID=200324 RepID=A0A2N5S2V8_9BASI|nr:hypothetical protein PCASD_23460 [Puccinia coronata f. sp. avenae]